MDLLFHLNTDEFYDETGNLNKEPEKSLEELLQEYDEEEENYKEFKSQAMIVGKDYVRDRWINNIKPIFIEDSVRNYGHRTWLNAEWSDITLAIAADMTSPGEITTKKAAGEKYVGVSLQDDFIKICNFPAPGYRLAEKVCNQIMSHPNFKKEGLKLNVAGNSQITLDRYGISTGSIVLLICDILSRLESKGVELGEIRSGGQTGVDEAAIKAAQYFGLKCSILAPKGFRFHYTQGIEKEGRKPFSDRFRERSIDYGLWESKNKDEAEIWEYNLMEFEKIAYEIDLKIMHINEIEERQNTSVK